MKLILITSLTFSITAISLPPNFSDSDATESSAESLDEPTFTQWAEATFDLDNFPDPNLLYSLKALDIETPEQFIDFFQRKTGLRIRKIAIFKGKPAELHSESCSYPSEGESPFPCSCMLTQEDCKSRHEFTTMCGLKPLLLISSRIGAAICLPLGCLGIRVSVW